MCCFKYYQYFKKKKRNRSSVIKGEDISSPHHPRYHELLEFDTYHLNTIGDMIFDCSWALDASLQHHVLGIYNKKKFFDFLLNTYEDNYVMKKNRPVTQFLYKYLNKEKIVEKYIDH